MDLIIHSDTVEGHAKADRCRDFLSQNQFDLSNLKSIDLTTDIPVMQDFSGNKFKIDFINDKKNYLKTKQSMKKELIARAMGSGRYGNKILDLSAGLGIDSVFLAQLGFSVTALERNPLIYFALSEAQKQSSELKVDFIFSNALDFLQNTEGEFPVIYFDPMFPEKTKSALPRQEMVFFRQMVGADEDSSQVLEAAIKRKGVRRVVVKRPIKAPWLGERKPQSSIEGKLIRFDIYGGSL